MEDGFLDEADYNKLNRHDVGIIRRTDFCKGRYAVKVLNLLILLALTIFVILRIHNGLYTRIDNIRDTDNKSGQQNLKNHDLISNTTKSTPVKVPWKFQIEDDNFVFPVKRKKERFITYRPSALRWSKQLLQFENAVVFAYLLKRTLLVPPLLPPMDKKRSNDNVTWNNATNTNESAEYEYPISRIVDFRALSSVVSLREVTMKEMDDFQTGSVFNICHDHRLGFWVDYIPSVENIITWRLLKAQQFTAFPISLDDHESDLMCPGTIQYSNRWGPPMHIKPILRGILTELYEKEEDLIYFEGDTLSTRDIRFFDKNRTKKLQEIMIFYLRFSWEINKRLKTQFERLSQPYNAILSGPLSENTTVEDVLIQRLEAEGFKETSRTVFVACRREDEEKFHFLRQHGYDVIFGLGEDKFTNGSDITSEANEIYKLCGLVVCAYASKFIDVGSSKDLYYVEHLRFQNVSMKDGLVTEKINPRWAQHTVMPKRDERVLLNKKKLAKLDSETIVQMNSTGLLLNRTRGDMNLKKELDNYNNNHNNKQQRQQQQQQQQNISNNKKKPDRLKRNDSNNNINNSKILQQNKNSKNNNKNNKQQQQHYNSSSNNTQTAEMKNHSEITNATHVSKTKPKKKFKSKLDIMVCTFCNYIRRITGEHGCPKLKSWCP